MSKARRKGSIQFQASEYNWAILDRYPQESSAENILLFKWAKGALCMQGILAGQI
jgi:hypothetical protein